jgi:hypothetical protein
VIYIFADLVGTISLAGRDAFAAGCLQGDCTMVGRRYWTRQAMTLLKFANLTKNPEFAAVLIEKAADLKSQVDDTNPAKDVSPRAPDVEPSP